MYLKYHRFTDFTNCRRKFYSKTVNKKSSPGWRAFFSNQEQLLVGLVPDFFLDESGEVATVFGFAFESVAGTAAFGVGDAFGDLGGDGFFVLDVVESVIHFFSP